MNQSVDVSSSVDQDVPVVTNVTSSSEFLGWIGDISQHLLSPEPGEVPSWLTTLAIIIGVSYAKRELYAHLGFWTDGDLDAMINHYCNQPPPLELSQSIRDQDKNTLLFPLNPDLGDLLEHRNVILIEGGPGEGKTTQVIRTLFDERFHTSTGQRPLILVGKFPFEVNDFKTLLPALVKRAMDRKIPVYIVTDDVQQVVDTCPDGKIGDATQSFFGTLMQLSLKYPGRVKIVYIASRMFSQDLSEFSGHDARFHTYQWRYDPALLRSTLEQSNNPVIVRHLDELLDMFGSRIQDYIRLMKLVNDVDNEEAYQTTVKQMKDKCRDQIKSALSAVNGAHNVAGAAQAHKLLSTLLEEQGEILAPELIANDKIIKILVHSNIIHANPAVTWASRFTSVVFKERYDDFAQYSGKKTSRKD